MECFGQGKPVGAEAMASHRSCAAGMFTSHDGGAATAGAAPLEGRRSPSGRGTPGTWNQNGIGAAKLACDNARNGLLRCMRAVSAQVLPGYGVGVACSVGGSVTMGIVSVGAGVAVVGVGAGAGDEVVGAGAGLLVVGAGAGEVAVDFGAAVEAPGLAGDVVEPWVAAASAAAAGPQDTLYAAGLDAVTAGLVTTRITSPVAGTHAWNVSASAACVPPEAKVVESGLVRSPSDIAQ